MNPGTPRWRLRALTGLPVAPYARRIHWLRRLGYLLHHAGLMRYRSRRVGSQPLRRGQHPAYVPPLPRSDAFPDAPSTGQAH